MKKILQSVDTLNLPSAHFPSTECNNNPSIQEDSINGNPSAINDNGVDSEKEASTEQSNAEGVAGVPHDDNATPSPLRQPLTYSVATISPTQQEPFIRGKGNRAPINLSSLTPTLSIQEIIAKTLQEVVEEERRENLKRIIYDNDNNVPIPCSSKDAHSPEKRPKPSGQRIIRPVDDSSGGEDIAGETEDSNNDFTCIYCNELYSESHPEEDWLRCMTCSLWVHTKCAKVSKRTKLFLCELCSMR